MTGTGPARGAITGTRGTRPPGRPQIEQAEARSVAAALAESARTPVLDLPAVSLAAELQLHEWQQKISGDPGTFTARHSEAAGEAERRFRQDASPVGRYFRHTGRLTLSGDEARLLAAGARSAVPAVTSDAAAAVMTAAAGALETVAGHCDAVRERDAVEAAEHAAWLLATAAGRAPGDVAAGLSRRAGELAVTMRRQVPLTDRDGQRVRVGDVIEVLSGKQPGERRTVTGRDTETALGIDPASIRLVTRAEPPAGPTAYDRAHAEVKAAGHPMLNPADLVPEDERQARAALLPALLRELAVRRARNSGSLAVIERSEQHEPDGAVTLTVVDGEGHGYQARFGPDPRSAVEEHHVLADIARAGRMLPAAAARSAAGGETRCLPWPSGETEPSR